MELECCLSRETRATQSNKPRDIEMESFLIGLKQNTFSKGEVLKLHKENTMLLDVSKGN